MSETRKIAAILVSDVVGYSRLAGADEDRILARLRAIRSDLRLIPMIAVHHGRVVKRTGDGAIVEFRSVVDAVRLAIEVQHGMIERNAGVPAERHIEFRIGIRLGDDRRRKRRRPDGRRCQHRRASTQGLAERRHLPFRRRLPPCSRARLDLAVTDLGPTQLKNIAEADAALFGLRSGFPRRQSPQCPPGRPRRKSVRRSCRSSQRSPHCWS